MHQLYDVKTWLKLVFLSFLLVGCGGSTEPTPALSAEPTFTPAQTRGKELFGALPGNCATCHSLQENMTIVGPSLHGIANRAGSRVAGLDAHQYLEQSLLHPDAYLVEGFGDLMPKDLAKKMTTAEVNDLIEFLLTLQ